MKLNPFYVLAYSHGKNPVVLHCVSKEKRLPLARTTRNAVVNANPRNNLLSALPDVAESDSIGGISTYVACASAQTPAGGSMMGRATRSTGSRKQEFYEVNELSRYFFALYGTSESMVCMDADGKPVRIIAALRFFGRS